MLAGSSRCASVALGTLPNASFVGAKTVNGPALSSVSTSLPALTAVTRVDRSGVATASSTMFLDGVCLCGISTSSMMCTTPLDASLSAAVTLALLTYTLPSFFTTRRSLPSTVFTSWNGFRSFDCTAPDTTWYVSTESSSLMLAGSSRCASGALGTLPKASFVGANTVNGPALSSVSTSLPALTAVTSVERSGVATASSTMFLDADAPSKSVAACLYGMSTSSMMCTTPFDASLSAAVTLALLTYTLPSFFTMRSSLPSTVFTSWNGFRSFPM